MAVGDVRERLTGVLRRERVRWRLSRKPLRLVVQAIGLAGLALTGFAFLRTSGEINETAASILVAVVFGAVTVLQQRQSQRRQYTVGLITAFQSADPLSRADIWMAGRISTRRQVGADLAEDDERHVIPLLDYYEFLAVLAVRGLVDVPLLLNLRGGTMTRCFELCRGYIADRRVRAGAEVYQALELLATEYRRVPSTDTAGLEDATGRVPDSGDPASVSSSV
ncbi:DUF4760 domain-containing protein [Plantactinospora endophytica]|uniref:Uncharacterized protein n=1 Tax=Plantactinospora endophytica TaxID=673535 RepID=A0ABQ4EE58_9ACTN|nr:hypothetical protein [Plantactinospora endophytica]GIG92996.1 hypothetical protein Pen02_79320 [Plantactinospora endophytica]